MNWLVLSEPYSVSGKPQTLNQVILLLLGIPRSRTVSVEAGSPGGKSHVLLPNPGNGSVMVPIRAL